MILCIVDTETSGLIIGESRIIEVAAVLYDNELQDVIEQWATLIYAPEYGNFSTTEAFNALLVNKISPMLLHKYGMHPKEAFKKLNKYLEKADLIVGHNVLNFDKPLLEFEAAQYEVKIVQKDWFDTRSDIDYPPQHYSRRLSHLASDYGIPTFDNHRALSDCITVAKLLKHFNLKDAVERAKSPLIRIIGEITFHENEKREEAKKRRFMWSAKAKLWYKVIRECDFDKENDITSFVIRKENEKDRQALGVIC